MPLLAALAFFGTPAFSQDKPKDPKKLAEEREKQAKEIFEAAQKLEEQGKLENALEKYQLLRDRFLSTRFVLGNMKELNEKLLDIGKRVAVISLNKQKFYRKVHVDHWYGYQFPPPDGWHGVPPMQQYYGDQVTSEIEMRQRVPNRQGVLRVARYTSNILERISLAVFKVFDAKSLDDVEGRVTDYCDAYYKSLKRGGSGEVRARIPARRVTFSSERGDRLVLYSFYGHKKGFALLGDWRATGGHVSLRIKTSDDTTTTKEIKPEAIEASSFEVLITLLDKCAASFLIHPPGRRSAALGAQLSDWNVMKSPKGSYIIEYDTTREFATRVGKEMEQILMLYKKVIPTHKAIPQCRIKVFDRKMDFHYYGAPMGAAAYWSPSQEEIVCYRFAERKVMHHSSSHSTVAEGSSPEEITFHILYHEGFHQYMYYMMGRGRGIYIPSWLNEGIADYFFGGTWETPSRFVIGPNDWRVAKIHAAVKEDKHVPLRKLLNYSQSQYYSNASLCYAEGWALNYFFLRSDAAKEKHYHMIPTNMISLLLKSGDWEKATSAVFKNHDLDEMEELFKAFVLTLPVPEKEEMEEEAEEGEGLAKEEGAEAPPESPTAGLVVSFGFNAGEGGHAADDSGKENHGEMKNGVSWTDGPSGKAIRFDGKDDYVSCGGTDLPAGNGNQTICFWFKPEGRPASTQNIINLFTGDTSTLQIGYRWKALALWHGDEKIMALSAPPRNKWFHMTYTYDGTYHMIHINGRPAIKSNAGAARETPTNLVLGRYEQGQRSYFKGSLDDLRIYSRVLSSKEIMALLKSE